MNKQELMDQSELLMQDLDDHLDILRKRMEDDRAATDVDTSKLRALEARRNTLQMTLNTWQERPEPIPPDEQERLRLDIADIKMMVARAIAVLE